MADTKLLPCPFCGQTDELSLDTLGDPDDWFVECDRCRLGTHAVFAGKERATAAWNTRALTSSTPVTNAEWKQHHTHDFPSGNQLISREAVNDLLEARGCAALTPKQAAADEAFDEMAKALKAVEEANQIGSWVPAMNKVRAALAKAGWA